jgi:hypothetical protein
MYDALKAESWERVLNCQHLKLEHRNRQSKKGLVDNGSVDPDDAELVLRCNCCYKKGQDCF